VRGVDRVTAKSTWLNTK